MPDAADMWLKDYKKNNPEQFADVARRHPLISVRARRRDRRGKVYEATDKRAPLSDDAKQRYRDQRAARKAALREWALDYHYAIELSEQGM